MHLSKGFNAYNLVYNLQLSIGSMFFKLLEIVEVTLFFFLINISMFVNKNEFICNSN